MVIIGNTVKLCCCRAASVKSIGPGNGIKTLAIYCYSHPVRRKQAIRYRNREAAPYPYKIRYKLFF